MHFDRSKNKLKFCCIVPLKEKEIDPCVNYKTVFNYWKHSLLLKMQVFVVFTGPEFWGNNKKRYIFIHDWTSRWFLLFHLPKFWGDGWIIAVVWLTTSFPESLNSTSSGERERGWLSIPKLINNSRRENKNKEIITVTKVGKN